MWIVQHILWSAQTSSPQRDVPGYGYCGRDGLGQVDELLAGTVEVAEHLGGEAARALPLAFLGGGRSRWQPPDGEQQTRYDVEKKDREIDVLRQNEEIQRKVRNVSLGAAVFGGGLASIDVVKIINLELYARALRERGIEVDLTEMELKGIPRTLEAHGISREELGIQGATLYYRRRKEDMPLASADDPSPEKLAKLQAARAKIMDRVINKYFVKFEELSRPVGTIVEDDRLAGIRFQKTEVVDGRVRGLEGTEFEVRNLNGRMDEFVILSRALTGNEVREMYEAEVRMVDTLFGELVALDQEHVRHRASVPSELS